MSADHEPHKHYDEEYKRSALELVEASGRTLSEIASELGIPRQTLYKWREKARRAAKPPGKALNAEQAELKELRRKLAYSERECDILKKALAICSREEKERGGLS